MSNILTSLSKAINGTSGNHGGLFNLNIPGVSIKNVTLLESSESRTLGELATNLTKTIGDIAQLAHTAYCALEVINHPQMLLNVLDRIGGQLVAVAMDMASRILNVLEGQIDQFIGHLFGTAINVISSVLSFLNSLLNLAEALINIYNSLKNLANKSFDNFMTQEQCEFMMAQMAMCMLNRMFGDKLKKFEDKITGKIIETGSSINKKLVDELASTNDIANFMKQESFMIDKASNQLNLIAGIF